MPRMRKPVDRMEWNNMLTLSEHIAPHPVPSATGQSFWATFLRTRAYRESCQLLFLYTRKSCTQDSPWIEILWKYSHGNWNGTMYGNPFPIRKNKLLWRYWFDCPCPIVHKSYETTRIQPMLPIGQGHQWCNWYSYGRWIVGSHHRQSHTNTLEKQ